MLKLLFWRSTVITIFYWLQVKSCWRNNIYWRVLPNQCFSLSKHIWKILKASLRVARSVLIFTLVKWPCKSYWRTKYHMIYFLEIYIEVQFTTTPAALWEQSLLTVELTNRKQEFCQWANWKQWEPQRNFVDIFPINTIYLICFRPIRVENGTDDRTTKAHLEKLKYSRGPYLDL